MEHVAISDQVRQLRQDLGLSQLEIAFLVGADPSAVSRWERGVAVPCRTHYERLCRLQSLARPFRCRACRMDGMPRVEPGADCWVVRCRVCGHILRTVEH